MAMNKKAIDANVSKLLAVGKPKQKAVAQQFKKVKRQQKQALGFPAAGEPIPNTIDDDQG
jgi:hypothetical protein